MTGGAAEPEAAAPLGPVVESHAHYNQQSRVADLAHLIRRKTGPVRRRARRQQRNHIGPTCGQLLDETRHGRRLTAMTGRCDFSTASVPR